MLALKTLTALSLLGALSSSVYADCLPKYEAELEKAQTESAKSSGGKPLYSVVDIPRATGWYSRTFIAISDYINSHDPNDRNSVVPSLISATGHTVFAVAGGVIYGSEVLVLGAVNGGGYAMTSLGNVSSSFSETDGEKAVAALQTTLTLLRQSSLGEGQELRSVTQEVSTIIGETLSIASVSDAITEMNQTTAFCEEGQLVLRDGLVKLVAASFKR